MRRLLSLMMICMLGMRIQGGAVAQEIFHAQGEFSGEPTATSLLLQSRLTKIPGPDLDESGDVPGQAGIACFEYSTHPSLENSLFTARQKASSQQDFIVRAKLENLKPGTEYYYRLHYGVNAQQMKVGPIRRCQTLPDANSSESVSFVMGSCQNYAFFMHGKNKNSAPASERDRQLGYPAYAAMLPLKPDFFIGTGDIVYYDHFIQDAAQTIPQMRKKWHEQFRFPRMVEFFGQTPAYWLKDDHDFRYNDADLGGSRKPDSNTGISLFREQLPLLPAGDEHSPTYRTHRIHKHVQLWFLEGRDYRSPNRMKDGPEKSIWGAEQKAWLMQTLKQSEATWKILISPTPMVGPDSKNKKDNHTNLGGFRHEAESFFHWLNEERLTNVITFCGDRHWQYHSVHPMGMEEFSCGAINDENAITGIKPGSPKSTDPMGLIDQKFLYPKASGGFLHVQVDEGPTLQMTFFNDVGEKLYSVTKEQ